MRFQASEVAAITGGELHGPDVVLDGASTDSRAVSGGELFVPVLDARDGHDFIGEALKAGAVAYLTSNRFEGATAIAVADTRAALTALGGAARSRLPDVVVGITGSVGKTSTKDLLAAALAERFRTHANPRSFNNELGVPLTLLNAPEDTEVTVLEMGARGRGHIAELCEVGRPTVGVVTAVELMHTELFGTIEEVAASKAELVEALPATGTAVLNATSPLVEAMASRTIADVVRYGTARSDIRARSVRVGEDLRSSFVLETPVGSAAVRLGARGEHHVMNALAAAAAAWSCGVPLDAIVVGLERAELSPWRMELTVSPTGARILNDAYNAGPTSTEAALRSLARLAASRRVAVLGPMAELGEQSSGEHRRIAEIADELGILVIAVGAPDYGVATFEDVESARRELGSLGPDDAALVKGSRVAGLERLVAALLGPDPTD